MWLLYVKTSATRSITKTVTDSPKNPKSGRDTVFFPTKGSGFTKSAEMSISTVITENEPLPSIGESAAEQKQHEDLSDVEVVSSTHRGEI